MPLRLRRIRWITVTLGGPATDDRPVHFDHWLDCGLDCGLDRGHGQSSIASAPATFAPTATIIAYIAKDAKWLRMGFGSSGGGNAIIDDINITTKKNISLSGLRNRL